MESLQENEVFEQEVIEMKERINKCDHVLMKVQSDEPEIKFRCLRGCGCDNTKPLTDPIFYLLSMKLNENIMIFNKIINENDNTNNSIIFADNLKTFIEEKSGKSIEECDDDTIMKLTLEFEELCWVFLLNECYSRIFHFDKHLINNPNLTEEQIIELFNILSEKDTLSSEYIFTAEYIVESINKAILDEPTALILK